MRRSTYARGIARIKAAEDIVDAHMLALVQKPPRKNKGNFPAVATMVGGALSPAPQEREPG